MCLLTVQISLAAALLTQLRSCKHIPWLDSASLKPLTSTMLGGGATPVVHPSVFWCIDRLAVPADQRPAAAATADYISYKAPPQEVKRIQKRQAWPAATADEQAHSSPE